MPPLYDFRCEKCNAVTEGLVKAGTEEIDCPECLAKAFRQVAATGSFRLKGSGWYKPSPVQPKEDK